MRLLYYALGGGHGHVVRGLALLRRLGHGTLLGPARLTDWARTLGVDYLPAPEPYDAAWIDTVRTPDLLLVDVFPRGVIAELSPLLARTPAWLITRLVAPAYYHHPAVRDVLASYECVVWTESVAADLRALTPRSITIPPVLLAPTPLTRAEARRELDVPSGRLLLALGSGDPEHQQRVCRLLEKLCARLGLTLRFISAELPPVPPVMRVFPAARVLAAAVVIIAAGGYHAFHEIRAAGVPAVFLPQRRRYDEQWRRVAGANVAADPYQLEALVRRLLADGRVVAEDVGDGAGALARLIERRVQHGVLPQEEVAPVA